MDIYSAESHVERVSQYLENVLQKRPKLYTKTRTRMRNLSVELNKCLGLISEILEEDSLLFEEEFDSDRSELASTVEAVAQSYKSSTEKMRELTTFVSSDSKQIDETSKLTTAKRKHIIYKYGQVIQSVASSLTAYPVVADCVRLLWKWFDNRFFVSPKLCPQFHYNIRKLPIWIRDIVICYGDSIEHNNRETFVSDFVKWCDSLLSPTDVTNSKFTLPFFVYDTSRNLDASNVSMAALCIWDMLWDAGFAKLCDGSLEGVTLSEYMIQDVFSKLDEERTSRYTYWNEDEKVLRQYRLL